MMVHACKFTTRDIETEESQVQNHLGDLVSSRPTWDGFDPSSKKKKKKKAKPNVSRALILDILSNGTTLPT